MSELSETLEATIKRREESNEAFKLARLEQQGKMLEIYPGFDHFAKWARWKINVIIRKGKAYYGGADPWPDGTEAVMQTAAKLETNIYLMLIEAISAGATIGMNRAEHPDQNWAGMFKYDQDDSLFWSQKVSERSAEIADDWDTMCVLRAQLTQCIGSYAGRAGVASWTGKDTLRVWDAWDHTLAATTTKLFLTGIEMGERWRDEEILEGIVKATESPE